MQFEEVMIFRDCVRQTTRLLIITDVNFDYPILVRPLPNPSILPYVVPTNCQPGIEFLMFASCLPYNNNINTKKTKQKDQQANATYAECEGQ